MFPEYENTSAQGHQMGTQVVRRVGTLLRAVATRNRVGARLTDLSTDVGIGRATAHRILQALVAEGLLRQDASKLYFLGNQIYEMGLAAAPGRDIRDVCHPYLQRIANTTGDSAFLTVRADFDGVCLDRVEGDFPIRVFIIQVGLRRPLSVGGGSIAILSCLADEEIERILKANAVRALERFPRYSEARVRKWVEQTRRYGYLVSEVIELPAVRTFAVPIRHPDGSPAGAISTSALASRFEGGLFDRMKSVVTDAVREIESALSPPPTGDDKRPGRRDPKAAQTRTRA